MDNDISDRYREDVEALKSKLADKEEQIRLTRKTYRALQGELRRLRSGIGELNTDLQEIIDKAPEPEGLLQVQVHATMINAMKTIIGGLESLIGE